MNQSYIFVFWHVMLIISIRKITPSTGFYTLFQVNCIFILNLATLFFEKLPFFWDLSFVEMTKID